MLEFWQHSHRVRHMGGRSLVFLTSELAHIVRLLALTVHATLTADASLIASSIGFYTLISLFPLMLLSVALASLWVDPLWAEGEIMTQLEFVAPALGDLLGKNMESIVRARGPVTSFAVLLLLWSASNIFNVIVQAMDKIWGVEKGRSGWHKRGIALLMAMVISALLLIGSTVEGIAVTVLNSLLPEELQTLRPYTNQLWAAVISILLFAVLYRVLPHKKLSWRDVLPGAVTAALLWELLKRGFLAFIDIYLTRSNLVYGSVTTIIVFLTWTYVSAILFLFGAHLNVLYLQSKQKISPVGEIRNRN